MGNESSKMIQWAEAMEYKKNEEEEEEEYKICECRPIRKK